MHEYGSIWGTHIRIILLYVFECIQSFILMKMLLNVFKDFYILLLALLMRMALLKWVLGENFHKSTFEAHKCILLEFMIKIVIKMFFSHFRTSIWFGSIFVWEKMKRYRMKYLFVNKQFIIMTVMFWKSYSLYNILFFAMDIILSRKLTWANFTFLWLYCSLIMISSTVVEWTVCETD